MENTSGNLPTQTLLSLSHKLECRLCLEARYFGKSVPFPQMHPSAGYFRSCVLKKKVKESLLLSQMAYLEVNLAPFTSLSSIKNTQCFNAGIVGNT